MLGLAWLVAAAGEGAGAGQELPGAGHQHGPRHQAGAHHAPQPGHLLTHHTTTDNLEWVAQWRTWKMKIWKRKAKRMSPAFLMMLTLPASSSCRDTVSPVCAVSSDLEILTL